MASIEFKLLTARRGERSNVRPFGALYNHEVWRVCANCGNWIDARLSLTCEDCGFINEI